MARLGPYELLRQVGTGGMGQVWLGRRAMAGGASKMFAIKVLAPRHLSSDRHREMFLEEARLSISLDHSNIIKVHEVGEFEGTWYMAMEWLDGLTLAQLNTTLRKRKQSLPPAVVGFVIGQVLRALGYAHEADHRGTKQPIVHRDVSPQNVMLTVTGDVKLLDFGIARVISDESSGIYVKGKPRYMSPEQFHGLSRGPTIDLFAVGALLHELLDGGRVFRWQAGDDKLLEVVGNGRIPELDTRGVPLELDELRRDLLAAEARRLPSARVALARLLAWSGYRDASLDIQDLVRTLVPVVPEASPAQPPRSTSSVGAFNDTAEADDDLLGDLGGDDLGLDKLDALGERERQDDQVGVDLVALPSKRRELVERDDDSIDDVLSRLADEGESESEGETLLRPASALGSVAPVPPPPPKLPERALEIDWIAVGHDKPKTGPHPAASIPADSGGSRMLVFGLIAIALVLALLGAATMLL
ncbi:serine/threonine-protein kinase [Nannocystaceae bacterium ST9]